MAIKLYEGFGESRSISDWAKRIGVSYHRVWEYINLGESIEEIVARHKTKYTTEDGRSFNLSRHAEKREVRQLRSRLYIGFGEEHTCSEWARRLGVPRNKLWSDLNVRGLCVEGIAVLRGVKYPKEEEVG